MREEVKKRKKKEIRFGTDHMIKGAMHYYLSNDLKQCIKTRFNINEKKGDFF